MKTVNLVIPSSWIYYPGIHKDCYVTCIRNPGWRWRGDVWCCHYVPWGPEASSLETAPAADGQTPLLLTPLFPPLRISPPYKTCLQRTLPSFLLPSITEKVQIYLRFLSLDLWAITLFSAEALYCKTGQGSREHIRIRGFCYFDVAREIKHHEKHESLIKGQDIQYQDPELRWLTIAWTLSCLTKCNKNKKRQGIFALNIILFNITIIKKPLPKKSLYFCKLTRIVKQTIIWSKFKSNRKGLWEGRHGKTCYVYFTYFLSKLLNF